MKNKRKKLKKPFVYLFLLFVLLGGFLIFREIQKRKSFIMPTIAYQDILTIHVGEKIDLLENLIGVNGEEVKITIEGEYDFNKEGEYALFYILKFRYADTQKLPFTLKVVKPNEDDKIIDDNHFVTLKGFQGEIIDGVTYIDGTLIVNKTYSLPSTYGNGLTKETKEAFNKLQSAALLDGFNIYITSGFRSYERQVTLYNNYVKRDGKEAADTYSARPGHSEHQSGLTFDVNEVSDKFHNTPEANWLSENCYKYGFILRFPNGKENETGYKYESWHFRYVGEELAKKLYNNGDWLTLEGYFGITSEYQD